MKSFKLFVIVLLMSIQSELCALTLQDAVKSCEQHGTSRLVESVAWHLNKSSSVIEKELNELNYNTNKSSDKNGTSIFGRNFKDGRDESEGSNNRKIYGE